MHRELIAKLLHWSKPVIVKAHNIMREKNLLQQLKVILTRARTEHRIESPQHQQARRRNEMHLHLLTSLQSLTRAKRVDGDGVVVQASNDGEKE
jgi:hypothetical protein